MNSVLYHFTLSSNRDNVILRHIIQPYQKTMTFNFIYNRRVQFDYSDCLQIQSTKGPQGSQRSLRGECQTVTAVSRPQITAITRNQEINSNVNTELWNVLQKSNGHVGYIAHPSITSHCYHFLLSFSEIKLPIHFTCQKTQKTTGYKSRSKRVKSHQRLYVLETTCQYYMKYIKFYMLS